MARLDVYRLRQSATSLVIELQTNLLDHIATRIVAPLVPLATAPKPIRDLNPIFIIDGGEHVMMTQLLGAVLTNDLRPTLISLDQHHDDVTRALDRLLFGY
jgi:toxin CcdB